MCLAHNGGPCHLWYFSSAMVFCGLHAFSVSVLNLDMVIVPRSLIFHLAVLTVQLVLSFTEPSQTSALNL